MTSHPRSATRQILPMEAITPVQQACRDYPGFADTVTTDPDISPAVERGELAGEGLYRAVKNRLRFAVPGLDDARVQILSHQTMPQGETIPLMDRAKAARVTPADAIPSVATEAWVIGAGVLERLSDFLQRNPKSVLESLQPISWAELAQTCVEDLAVWSQSLLLIPVMLLENELGITDVRVTRDTIGLVMRSFNPKEVLRALHAFQLRPERDLADITADLETLAGRAAEWGPGMPPALIRTERSNWRIFQICSAREMAAVGFALHRNELMLPLASVDHMAKRARLVAVKVCCAELAECNDVIGALALAKQQGRDDPDALAVIEYHARRIPPLQSITTRFGYPAISPEAMALREGLSHELGRGDIAPTISRDTHPPLNFGRAPVLDAYWRLVKPYWPSAEDIDSPYHHQFKRRIRQAVTEAASTANSR